LFIFAKIGAIMAKKQLKEEQIRKERERARKEEIAKLEAELKEILGIKS